MATRFLSPVLITPTTEASLTTNGALTVGGAPGTTRLTIDLNEIQAISSANAAATLDLNPAGGSVTSGGGFFSSQVGMDNTTVAALTNQPFPGRFGPVAGLNVIVTGSAVQSRNNGATATLTLNPLGGIVTIPDSEVSLGGLGGSLIIGSVSNSTHIAFDASEIHAKANNTTAGVLNLNPHGGSVVTGAPLHANISTAVVLATSPAPLQVGLSSSANIAMGGNVIQSRINGAAAQLGLNTLGGNVICGSNLEVNGQVYVNASGYVRFNGNAGVYWDAHGGGWYMDDTLWVKSYAGKSIYTTGAIVADSGASTFIAGASTAQSTNNRLYVKKDTTGAWGDSHIIIRNANSSLGQCSSMAFHAYNVAPIIKCYNGAEAIEIRNNPDSDFAPIKANSFVVSSTLRVKTDVVEESDDLILGRVKPSKQIRFRHKTRPQYIRKEARFKELDERWQASGKSALTPKLEHLLSVDHDCGIDECGGTLENPCSITLNDTEVIGLAAEAVYEYFPEAVSLDQDGLPMGIDVAQIATSAFAAVGVLARKIEELEQQIKNKK